MKTLVFTICARNYTGLAKVLGQSVARYGADVDFRIYVAEGIDTQDEVIRSAPEALRSIIDASEFANMAFMYNLTEFCTALKAACFMRGFADEYDRCIYMDPDILVTADLDHVSRALDDSLIVMTPHLCLPANGNGPRTDRGILATGVYNLGFLALREGAETHRFLNWWHARLRGQAFNDHYSSLYTDQRWMDFVPSLFDRAAVRVWRHLGCNVAPWNYHERQITRNGDGGYVVHARDKGAGRRESYPLVFLHFSGFDFRRILDGRFDQLNLAGAETFPDLLPLYERYGEAIRSMADEMARYLSMPYAFDRFADGSVILPSHRRLFRVWRERNGDALDPFATGPGSFHNALRARRLLGTTRDLALDKTDGRTVDRPDRLLARAHTVFRLIFRLLGRGRYFLFVRALTKVSHVEQHYDAFRLDDAAVTPARRSEEMAQ